MPGTSLDGSLRRCDHHLDLRVDPTSLDFYVGVVGSGFVPASGGRGVDDDGHAYRPHFDRALARRPGRSGRVASEATVSTRPLSEPLVLSRLSLLSKYAVPSPDGVMSQRVSCSYELTTAYVTP